MTPIGIQRIEKRLEVFNGLIDLSDVEGRPQQQRGVFLSRALAAYVVKVIAGTDAEAAAKSVTDTFHDRGIDAIFYDPGTARLFVIQSKWSNGIAWKDAGEFVDGVRKLITPDLDAFSKNPRINARRAEIQSALLYSARIVIVTAHYGPKPADAAVLGRVNELATEIDGGSGLAEAVHWHQQNLLNAIQEESAPPTISAALYLENWGEIKEPYHAVFGRVQGRAIAELGQKYLISA